VSPDQQHVCTVQFRGDGTAYLAFEPSTGTPSSYSASLATLDLRVGVTTQEARELAAHINRLLWGVSATVF
jgi:hypothetical protein